MTDVVNAVLENYNKHVNEMLAIRAEASKKLGESLSGLFTEFFKENPEIKYITWTQYTDYFNDGDPCTFGVHDKWFVPFLSEDGEENEIERGYSAEDIAINVNSYCDDDPQSYLVDVWGKDRYLVVKNACNNLDKILDRIPDDIYEEIWGDHVSILVTRDGIEAEEYDHD